VIQQNEIRTVRSQAGILARDVWQIARIDAGRFSLIEQGAVTARTDEMDRIDAALVELISKRLSAIRALEADRGLKLANA
jgi:hypothetical protein